jgi:hypothetical protein
MHESDIQRLAVTYIMLRLVTDCGWKDGDRGGPVQNKESTEVKTKLS